MMEKRTHGKEHEMDKMKTMNNILEFCKKYYKEHEYMPSLEDIAFELEYANTSGVGYYVREMICNGMLETDHFDFGRIHARAFRIGKAYR